MEWFVKAKRAQTATDDETWTERGVSPTLNAFDQGDTRATVVAVMAPTLTAHNNPSRSPQSSEITAQVQAVVNATDATIVRRLTPTECERLQGFPDDWTAGQADTHRYKQMGNAVTVNVIHYIGTLLPAVSP